MPGGSTMWNDLREFLDCLERQGELVTVERQVDTKYEISAGLQRTSELQGPALLFRNVKGYKIPVTGAIFSTRKRVLLALDMTRENYVQRFLKGLENPIPPKISESGPCQEVVLTGDDLDVRKLPNPFHAPRDGGLYITGGVAIAKHPEYGRNASIHRHMIIGRNKLTSLFAPQRHLDIYRRTMEEKGKPLDVAVAIGMDPVIVIASQTTPPRGIYGDELAVAGGLRGEPVELTKCKTIDVEVPSTSEIVIEGRFLPNVRAEEGPFGEAAGYYGSGEEAPVIEVTAITMRRNPIYQAIGSGKPPAEIHGLVAIPKEASFYKHMKQICPTLKAVHFTPGGTTQHHVAVSINQIHKHQAKNVILAALGAGFMVKHVVVVDDDIDIYNPTEIEWAIATRVQADSDVYIFPNIIGGPVDPSRKDNAIVSGMGIDATRPYGEHFAEVVEIPGTKDFELPIAKNERGR